MSNLSPVKDDHANIRQTVEMMGIPKENVLELRDASYG